MSTVVAAPSERVEPDAAHAQSSNRFSSASETLVSTTATPRAVGPSLAIASSVQRLSVPYVDGVTTTFRAVPSRCCRHR